MADRTLEFFPIFRFNLLTKGRPMATTQARGTKRTCQNQACGQRFYDLEHDPIMCPICGSNYNLALSSAALAAAAAEEKAARKAAKKPTFVEPTATADDAVADDGAEVLPEIEGDDEPVAAESDETFLEEEEDEGDVSGIVGGVTEGDEEV
jgi:uncharacterized protein (TIGR02300 family)